MRLLVATSCSLLVVDSENGISRVVERNPEAFLHSLTLAPDAIYIAARDRTPTATGEQSKQAAGRILVYDYDLTLRKTLLAPFPMRDVHQIAYHDGRLYVTCTADNMIAIYDGADWSKWYPLPEYRDQDIHHFNSILIRGAEIYVLAHNNDRAPSEVFRFDAASRRIVGRFALGHQAHNIWMDRGMMFTCDSARGQIASQRATCITRIEGFPRGVAVTKRVTVVGVSEVASRKDRHFTTGYLLIYTPRWRQLRKIVLQQEGVVFEVRAPGVEDLCLPHGPLTKVRVPEHLPTVQFPVEHARWSLVGSLPAAAHSFAQALHRFVDVQLHDTAHD